MNVRVELWKLIRTAGGPLHNDTLTGDYLEMTPIHQVEAIAVASTDLSPVRPCAHTSKAPEAATHLRDSFAACFFNSSNIFHHLIFNLDWFWFFIRIVSPRYRSGF